MSTVGVLLAADAGIGFSPSKYTSPLRGSTLLGRSVESALSWPVDEVLVVLGADAEAVEETVDLGAVSVIVDPSWDEGLAAPVRAVLDLLSREGRTSHVVIGMGDQPDVAAVDVARLLEARSAADAVVPKYRYAAGFPVVLGRSAWDVFLRLEGDIDIHDVIATHAGSVEEVWFDHLAPKRILDPSDLPETRR